MSTANVKKPRKPRPDAGIFHDDDSVEVLIECTRRGQAPVIVSYRLDHQDWIEEGPPWYAAYNAKYDAAGRAQPYAIVRHQPKPGGGETTESLARWVLSRALGRPLLPTEQAEHVFNVEPTDCRRSNLRVGTAHSNQRDQLKHRAGRVPGVKRSGRRWLAQVRHDGRTLNASSIGVSPGNVPTKLEAHRIAEKIRAAHGIPSVEPLTEIQQAWIAEE